MTLREMLPQNYQHSDEITETQQAVNAQVEKLRAEKDDLLLQLNIETATWGLGLWEKAYGLETDPSKSYAFRRAQIESKMRSLGVTTVEMIRNVAESFSDDNVSVIEFPSEYSFLIKFKGTPPNFDDLTNTIEEIKPAHLAWNFIYIMQGMVSFGSANISGESGRVLPDIPGTITSQGLLTAGSAEKSGESTVVFPEIEDTVTSQSPLVMACFLKIGEHAKITS